MNIKKIITFMIMITTILILTCLIIIPKKEKKVTNTIKATILNINEDTITVLDNETNSIYNLPYFLNNLTVGDILVIQYAGLIDPLQSNQDINIIDYSKQEVDENGIPTSWNDDGIFSDYYIMAYKKLKELTLEEKIGQVLLARHPQENDIEVLQKYNLGGYVFYKKDFENKDASDVKRMINLIQDSSKIPLLTAVDEEGGNVVRISSNPKLVSEPFKSPRQLYELGGFPKIKEDTIKKSEILSNLGLNVNLAPVVDISTNPDDYMYNRTIGEGKEITSLYAKTVIEASKKGNVSYTLKHFPGYGNNIDTHLSSAIDNRSYDDIINNDITPFKAGIDAGAEAVMVSHNVVTSIDSNNPASLSIGVHNLLRNNLNFTGVIITDDIGMSALDTIVNIEVKSLLAGNDIIITDNYEESFNNIKNAITSDDLNEYVLEQHVFKVLAWKYYKGLMFNAK